MSAAALAGPINAVAFPGRGLWPLVFLGTALMFYALIGRSSRSAFAVGLVGGFAFFGTHIYWLTIYLGPIPWLALAGLQSIFFALGAMLIALAWRFVPKLWPGAGGRLGMLPIVLGGLWTLREAIAAVWPYGGFSWGRLAFSQSESPFAPLVAWIGTSGLSFVIATLSALLLQCVLETRIAGTLRGIVATAAIVAVLAVPAWPFVSTGSFRVAAVQGNSNAGLFAQRAPGDTLREHVDGPIPHFGEDVDLLVWPENSADIDPLRHPESARVLDSVSSEMDAPLVAGTITADSAGRMFNSLLLWKAGEGAVQQYDKIHPVPFAEYLPDRAFWYPLAPSLFDLVPRDFSIGTRPNVFDIDGTKAGVAICFDIVDDGLIDQMVDGGAELILAPTNNADFGHTDESVQQLAIARVRAMELGRSVVNISTVGTSAIILADGSTLDQLPRYTAAVMESDVPTSSTVTPAVLIGRQVEWLVSFYALAILFLGGILGRRSRG
jgi:apolipoprotein N-acyltransferase